MTKWLDGYGTRFLVQRVDQDTWTATGEVREVRSFNISRNCTDTVPLLETAEIVVDGDFEEGWYQLSAVFDQGAREKVALGTFLFEGGATHYDYGVTSITSKGYSVLKPAEECALVAGDYAPSGVDGPAYAASLLRKCLFAPVTVTGSFTLSSHVPFAVGCTVLAAVWKVLDAGGYCIMLDGDGTVNIRELPTEPALELDRVTVDLVLPGIDGEKGIDGVVNRYIAIDGSNIATAENRDIGSKASYERRGRWVDFVDQKPVRVDGESLEAYAERRLAEESTLTRKKSYVREFYPGVIPFSIVRGAYAKHGFDGDCRVMSQTLSCDRGIKVSETVGYKEAV